MQKKLFSKTKWLNLIKTKAKIFKLIQPNRNSRQGHKTNEHTPN